MENQEPWRQNQRLTIQNRSNFYWKKKNADCQVKYTSNDLRELNDSIKAGRYEKRLVEIEYKYDHLEFIYRFVVAKIRKSTFRESLSERVSTILAPDDMNPLPRGLYATIPMPNSLKIKTSMLISIVIKVVYKILN